MICYTENNLSLIHPCTAETIYIAFINSQSNAKYCYAHNFMAELLNTDQHIHIKFMIVVSTGMKGREYKQEKIKRQLKITYRIFFS